MKRTKLQLFCSVTGICLVFAMCSLILPELRADSPREPVPAYVAEHLPADTRTLYFFRSAELDANGVKLLQKTSELFATLDRNLFAVLTLMSATEKNKGLFYMAMAPDSWYTLVRNGAKSDEIVLAPNLSHRETTARMLRDGYFLLFPASAKQPKMGLSTELRERIAAEPDDIFRSATSGHPARIRIFKRDGAYMVSALLPEKAEEEFSVAAIIGKATAGLPAAESAEKKAFIEKNLKFSDVTVEGRKLLELEFPLTEETLTEWAEFARRLRDERIRKNAPQVVSVEPANGAEGVDPNLKEIKVTFDRPMSDNSWSFCQRSEIDFPEVLSKPSYNKERTVITLPVRLVPERTYNIYLNSPPFLGFRSAEGGVLPVYHHTFTTGKAAKAK